MFDTLNDENFPLYAVKYYDNPSCTDPSEFYDDLDRIKYIKRLMSKYARNGELNERLILNHLTVLYNVFDPKACTRMLCFKLWDHIEVVKTFLIYLNYWPIEDVVNTPLTTFNSSINIDANVANTLRSI